MPINDNYNFQKTGIYDRVKALVGGNEARIKEWWITPLAMPPFNLRTPADLMNENEWRLVRNFLIDNVAGDYLSDNDFKTESERFGFLVDINKVFSLTDRAYGYGGSESKLYLYQPAVKPFDTPVYRVHTFNSSGELLLERGGEIEFLLVGGGGGGGGAIGNNPGGGGGGGGVVIGTINLQPGRYEVVVGAGGAGGTEGADLASFAGAKRRSSNGGDSKFGKIIAYGGGAGGHSSTNFSNGNPLSGATGGGGSPEQWSTGSPSGLQNALNTTVPRYNPNRVYGAKALYGDTQGYKGGNAITAVASYANPLGGSYPNTAFNAGGGGGAGGPGGNATNLKAGDGGIGRISDITGNTVYYGGGGAGGCYGWDGYAGQIMVGGGAGGLGGGASTRGYEHITYNNTSYVPDAGVANTGGGGAGGSTPNFGNAVGNAGSAGGTGVVIIRYRLKQ